MDIVFSRDGLPYILAAAPQAVRQIAWDWALTHGYLFEGAPRVAPADNWKVYLRGVLDGGGGGRSQIQFRDYNFTRNAGPVTNATTTPVAALSTSFVTERSDRWRFGWEISVNALVSPALVAFIVDGTTVAAFGSEITTTAHPYSGFWSQTLPSGNHTVALFIVTTNDGDSVAATDIAIERWRTGSSS